MAARTSPVSVVPPSRLYFDEDVRVGDGERIRMTFDEARIMETLDKVGQRPSNTKFTVWAEGGSELGYSMFRTGRFGGMTRAFSGAVTKWDPSADTVAKFLQVFNIALLTYIQEDEATRSPVLADRIKVASQNLNTLASEYAREQIRRVGGADSPAELAEQYKTPAVNRWVNLAGQLEGMVYRAPTIDREHPLAAAAAAAGRRRGPEAV